MGQIVWGEGSALQSTLLSDRHRQRGGLQLWVSITGHWYSYSPFVMPNHFIHTSISLIPKKRRCLHKHYILLNQNEYPNQNDFISSKKRWHSDASCDTLMEMSRRELRTSRNLPPHVGVAAHDWCWHPPPLCCSCPVVVLLLLLTTTLASTSQHLDNWPLDHLQRQNWHQLCKCIS